MTHENSSDLSLPIEFKIDEGLAHTSRARSSVDPSVDIHRFFEADAKRRLPSQVVVLKPVTKTARPHRIPLSKWWGIPLCFDQGLFAVIGDYSWSIAQIISPSLEKSNADAFSVLQIHISLQLLSELFEDKEAVCGFIFWINNIDNPDWSSPWNRMRLVYIEFVNTTDYRLRNEISLTQLQSFKFSNKIPKPTDFMRSGLQFLEREFH